MPTYLTTDGRGATRMFSTEPDALIYWYYNNCRGSLYQLQDDTGIMMDKARRDTHMWASHCPFNIGNRSQAAAIHRYMNDVVSANIPLQEPINTHNQVTRETVTSPVQVIEPSIIASNDTPQAQTTTHNSSAVANEALIAERDNMMAEIKRLRTFVTISDAELVEQNKALEEAWRLELEERNKLEQQRQSILREKQRAEEAEKIFESGKQTYRQIKREICTGLTTPDKIPEQFIRRYMVYKRMDEAGLIDLPGDWENYQDITDQLKEEEFENDKIKYRELCSQISNGECKESDVPLEFENQYRVFRVMEQQNVLDGPDCYDMFLELLGDYMGAWNDCKYALSNDAHYLEDVNIKPRDEIAVNDNENDEDDPVLSSEEVREKYGIVAGTDAADQLQGMHSFLDQ